ncbi:hypothetical protein Lfu02_39670 [Longispora fulva]|uniref:Phage tail-like protein n=1 Tax=Longispora fulva TaxID=619741 RepID=A0A8J7KWD7_9ACTN|nr:phage tail protein I [Longispora fulva]MBG6136427.1 phage tail-like protein [Longispora fulva]GIG59595.1 hypothetical protein Lfu02_39670 [Longispora fulva]
MTATVPDEVPDDMRDHPVVNLLAHVADGLLDPVRRVALDPGRYLDPATAPPDVLAWLAILLGMGDELDTPPKAHQRRILAAAVDLHRRRGTVSGLRDLLRLYGADAQITEQLNDGPPQVTIRVTLAEHSLADEVSDAIARSVPVHVRTVVVFER